MLLMLYKLLNETKNQRIKVKLYSYLGFLANLYIQMKYFWVFWMAKDYQRKADQDSQIIVSLTTFPARIEKVYLTIFSLMEQTVKPSKIILWLADTQFLSEEMLPSALLRLRKRGLEIRFCDDLKSHKKYYYTLREFSTFTIITVDDDVLYPPNTIEKLIEKSKQYPDCICCNRGHEITFTDGKINAYSEWVKEAVYLNKPSMILCPTGVGGVLYPPGSLHRDCLDKEKIIQNAIMADDLWLKWMALLQGTKAVYTDGFPQWLFLVIGTQKETLAKTNVHGNNNDNVISNMLKLYPAALEVLSSYKEKDKAI